QEKTRLNGESDHLPGRCSRIEALESVSGSFPSQDEMEPGVARSSLPGARLGWLSSALHWKIPCVLSHRKPLGLWMAKHLGRGWMGMRHSGFSFRMSKAFFDARGLFSTNTKPQPPPRAGEGDGGVHCQ
ncbi:hypothetical protein H1C71_032680, partial [Ictidomys tridecemlineatus]